jgi:xylulokinase
VPAETVGAAYGDALLAAKGVGLVAPDANWARVAETVTPEPGVRSLYSEFYALYRSLCPATRDQAHALAAIQRREAEPKMFRS